MIFLDGWSYLAPSRSVLFSDAQIRIQKSSNFNHHNFFWEFIRGASNTRIFCLCLLTQNLGESDHLEPVSQSLLWWVSHLFWQVEKKEFVRKKGDSHKNTKHKIKCWLCLRTFRLASHVVQSTWSWHTQKLFSFSSSF